MKIEESLLIAALSIAVVFSSLAAQAQAVCGNAKEVLRQLETPIEFGYTKDGVKFRSYGEVRAGFGFAGNSYFALFGNEGTGSWTLLKITAYLNSEDIACVMAAGSNGYIVDGVPNLDHTPPHYKES